MQWQEFIYEMRRWWLKLELMVISCKAAIVHTLVSQTIKNEVIRSRVHTGANQLLKTVIILGKAPSVRTLTREPIWFKQFFHPSGVQMNNTRPCSLSYSFAVGKLSAKQSLEKIATGCFGFECFFFQCERWFLWANSSVAYGGEPCVDTSSLLTALASFKVNTEKKILTAKIEIIGQTKYLQA
jgi:hypothetical protein